MTRLQQTRRELLKSGAAMSAAVSFAKYGITPSWSAAGAKKDGLNVVDEVLRQAAETKEVPGVVAVAANSDGVIYEGAFGKRDLANGTDMTADSVFWIASMTKALTATAAMQLVEQGKLQLDEPISKVLPELAAPQVLEGFDDKGQPKLRPAKRPITLRQLLTHTAGFTYDLWDADTAQYVKAANLPGIISCKNAALTTPLAFDPGDRWDVRHQHRFRRQGGRGGQRTGSQRLSARAHFPAARHERHRLRHRTGSEEKTGDRACAQAGRRA